MGKYPGERRANWKSQCLTRRQVLASDRCRDSSVRRETKRLSPGLGETCGSGGENMKWLFPDSFYFH